MNRIAAQPSFKYEKDLGVVLIPYLKKNPHVIDLYQEVVISNSTSCDAVFREDDGCINCVELKLRFNFEVLYQALRWKNVADKVWIAVPSSQYDYRKMKVVEALGIGVFTVSPYKEEYKEQVAVFGAVKIEHTEEERKRWKWSKYLSRRHADDVQAGSKEGNRSTPFSRTAERVSAFFYEHPRASIKKCISIVPHHYGSDSSARACVKDMIKKKVIKVPRITFEHLIRS